MIVQHKIWKKVEDFHHKLSFEMSTNLRIALATSRYLNISSRQEGTGVGASKELFEHTV